MIAADLCSGIGGASCALEACGVEVVAHAEIELHASNVLKRRWPDVPNVGDWTSEAGRAAFREAASGVDILTGGVPCQGYSAAGKRLGWADPRNLFPALFTLLGEWGDDGPPIVLVENVPGLLTADNGDAFGRVVEGFERVGYSTQWDVCSAIYAGAPHVRERVWIVARREGVTWETHEQPSMWPGRPQRWPRAGAWSGGVLTECRPQWPTPRAPRGGVAWPTPATGTRGNIDPETELRRMRERADRGEVTGGVSSLAMAVVRAPPGLAWPTIRTGDEKQGPSSTAKHLESGDIMLSDAVRLPLAPGLAWATASARDWKSGQAGDETFDRNARPLSEQVERGQAGARLNPAWVETLMGFPVGHTDIDCDAPELRPYPLPMAVGDDGEPLYRLSPQGPWEPPRVVVPVKGDRRRHRLRGLGNAWEQGTARTVVASVVASVRAGVSADKDMGAA